MFNNKGKGFYSSKSLRLCLWFLFANKTRVLWWVEKWKKFWKWWWKKRTTLKLLNNNKIATAGTLPYMQVYFSPHCRPIAQIDWPEPWVIFIIIELSLECYEHCSKICQNFNFEILELFLKQRKILICQINLAFDYLIRDSYKSHLDEMAQI